jgi:hypothetical protein
MVGLNLGPTTAELGSPAVSSVNASALYPGKSEWMPLLAAVKHGADWELLVELHEGCALVKVALA